MTDGQTTMPPGSPPVRGRAARSNVTGRFERTVREAVWDEGNDPPPERLETSLMVDHARSVITRNASPDLGFDRTINPYRGCEHGCIYCYARPTHAWLGLSPGLDFETKLFHKPEAARLLREELSRPSYRVERVQLGASTDPYQPVERRLETTRGILGVLSDFNHPVSITTKGALVARDRDILGPMAERGLALVVVSVTTLDGTLARSMEPRASTPERRIEAIRDLGRAGVPVVVGASPMIPGLNDHEMEAILEAAAAAGAVGAYYTALRLPLEIKTLFREWLAAEHPDRAARVISLVRQMRGGKDYDPAWGTRMRGEGPVADMLAARFKLARRRLGLDRRVPALRTDLFRPPEPVRKQLDLFGPVTEPMAAAYSATGPTGSRLA